MYSRSYKPMVRFTPDLTNAVSCYGRLYNAVTFNNGYHQEHHLRPAVHWTKIAALKKEMAPAQKRRIVPFSHMTNPFVPLSCTTNR